MKLLSAISVITTILVLTSCNSNTEDTSSGDSFKIFLDNYYQEGLELMPLKATQLGIPGYNDKFPDFLSEDYQQKQKDYYTRYLMGADEFPDSILTEDEQLSKTLLQWKCATGLEEMQFHNEYFPIDQMWSVNLTIAQWGAGLAAQPFETPEDYEHWLSRLKGYMTWMETAQTRMREGMEAGYVHPKSLIVKVIPQIRDMVTDSAELHHFYGPVHKIPDSFSVEEKQKIKKRYKETIEQELIPAYGELLAFLEDEYLPAARESSGIGAFPDGEEWYAFRIKKNTTTDLTAEEIHQIGLSEVARIQAEMEKVKDEVGFEGDLKSFFNFVRNNPALKPYDTPQQIIDNFNDIHARMVPQLEVLFELKPKSDFEVRQVEAFREKSSAAHYNPPATDGSRPGIFYVPIPDAENYNVYSDESLFLHEAIPGHHYQIALTLENEDLPEFRKDLWVTAYGEGWALYAESLGRELGLYTDPYQYFGMLSLEIHRAIRLVVDAGIHAKGWTREQAIQYSLENEAQAAHKIEREIERYMANPGQALGYKIGQLKILELRGKAENELGDKFDIKAFHTKILESGCLPLAILEEKIDEWIEAEKRGEG